MKVYKSEEAKFKAKKPVLTMEDITGPKKQPAKAMPTLPRNISALPHCIARSALFSPIRRGRRQYRRQEIIASRDDASISYTGEQLDIADQDVFLQVIREAQGQLAGETCLFERSEFLRDIGRKSDGKSAYDWLDKSFKRLMGGFMTVKTTVKNRKIEISMQIINDYGIDKDSGVFFVDLNPRSSDLFQVYGHIDMTKRKLIKHDFSKWLQGYVSSHEKGRHFVKVEKLHEWSGCSDELRFFKCKRLKPALAELQALKIIKNVKIIENIVEWIRI